MPRPETLARYARAKQELAALLSTLQSRHGLSNNEFSALIAGELANHTTILVDQDRDQEDLRGAKARKKNEG